MPRYEHRTILWKQHADERLIQRGISRHEAETIIRGGAWHTEGVGLKGEPKWAAEGSIKGQRCRIIFVETTQGTLEVLWVITAMVLQPGQER